MRYFDNRLNNQIHAQQWYRYVLDKYPNEIKLSVMNSKIYDFTDGSKSIINGNDVYTGYAKENLPRFSHTFVNFHKLTTVDSLFRLHNEMTTKELGKVAVLNFASFKNPGGRFIDGSSAQEESLCHESTLYPVLMENKQFYEENKTRLNNGLYSHRVLYTPYITFEKDGKIVVADVITCAFPNLQAIQRKKIKLEPEYYNKIISHRIMSILDTGVVNNVDTIILGAIGCGVFRNDPSAVAIAFGQVIRELYLNKYQRIIFAIPDQRTYNIFTQLV